MSDAVYSKRKVSTENTGFNQLSFVVKQHLNKMRTATLVKVVGVTPNGDGTGFLDVLPLVNSVGSDGAIIENVPIYDVPYLRLSGGPNVVICDPAVGDVGFCVFADSDVSSVMGQIGPATAPSERKFSPSDALYVGTCLPVTAPQRYIKISDAGVQIFAPEDMAINAPAIATDAALKIAGKQVVGAQQSAVSFTAGGPNPDPNSQSAIQGIINVLKAHGLTA